MRRFIIVLFLLILALPVQSATMVSGRPCPGGTGSCVTEVTGDSDTSGSASTYALGHATRIRLGGTWTASESYTSCEIDVRVKKVGSPTGAITVKVYTTSEGTPKTAIATASNTISAASVSTNFQTFTMSIAGEFTNGTVYFLSLETTTNDAENYYLPAFNETGTGLEKGYYVSSWVTEDSSSRIYMVVRK